MQSHYKKRNFRRKKNSILVLQLGNFPKFCELFQCTNREHFSYKVFISKNLKLFYMCAVMLFTLWEALKTQHVGQENDCDAWIL